MDFISVGIILLGAFVAGARDLSFDAYAYAVVFIANICTAVYLASIAHIGNIFILTSSHCSFMLWLGISVYNSLYPQSFR